MLGQRGVLAQVGLRLLAAAINVPLFAVFAAVGELRNLSLMFVGFAILIGKALEAEPALPYNAQRG